MVLCFFNDTATTEIYTLSLHDALPICSILGAVGLISTVGSALGQVLPVGASLLFDRIGFGYMTAVMPFVTVGVILLLWKVKETKGVDLDTVVYEDEI